MAKRREWQEEFDMAERILASEGGVLDWASDDYVAFRYISNDVRLVFYPHKSSAGNYHIRVRVEPCKNKKKAEELITRLDIGAGHNCTFGRKLSSINARLDYAKRHGLEFGWAQQK